MYSAQSAVMADDDAIKAAELRGYSRGYAAGKKREYAEHQRRVYEAKERAFKELSARSQKRTGYDR